MFRWTPFLKSLFTKLARSNKKKVVRRHANLRLCIEHLEEPRGSGGNA